MLLYISNRNGRNHRIMRVYQFSIGHVCLKHVGENGCVVLILWVFVLASIWIDLVVKNVFRGPCDGLRNSGN